MLDLRIITGAYDAFEPLRTGDIDVPGIRLNWSIENDPPRLFTQVLGSDDFDVAEMSLAQYVRRFDTDNFAFTAIPVFPLRMFRHAYVIVSAESEITSPQGIEGKRVGVPDYWQTAAVWTRGILRDEFDVDWSTCTWVQGGMDSPRAADVLEPTGTMPHGAPGAGQGIRVDGGESLDSKMQRGELDVTIGARVPVSALRSGHARALFDEPIAVEQEYFARTGVFPIMHVLVVRNTLLHRLPDIAGRMVSAFQASYDRKWQRMLFSGANPSLLPWGYQAAVEAEGVFAGSPWRQGLDENRVTLERFLRYLQQDGFETASDVEHYFVD